MKSEAMRGHVDALLLAVLAEGPSHGYELIERLRERSDGTFDLPEGTIYPALHRLERAGLLESRWSAGAARRRRVYDLSHAGRRALAGERSEWERLRNAIDTVWRDVSWTAT